MNDGDPCAAFSECVSLGAGWTAWPDIGFERVGAIRDEPIALLDPRHVRNSGQNSSKRKAGIGRTNRGKDHGRDTDVVPMILLESTMKFARESIDYAHAAALGLGFRSYSIVLNPTPDQRPAARRRDPNARRRIHERAPRGVGHELGDNQPQTPALLRLDFKFSLQQFKLEPPKL
jgi:hypothetical protein